MAGTELAVGYVSIVPSGRGFGRAIIREASSAGSIAGDSASSNFGSRFVGSMARIGKRAAVALTAGVGTAAFFGVRTAANFEQTRIAFEGILGDVDKANRLLGQLRDFAARTPFEFTGLAESAKNLLAVGFEADEILPTMETLGNVAATLGVGEAEISGVVRALGQMRGKGKASAEELQQISEQIPGFSAIKAIAEDMGITTAEAFEEMRKGAIPADDAIESILAGMESFPGAAGAMDRQSKTLNGVLSTFRDTLEGIAIDFITPHLPALSSGVQAAGEVLKGFFDGLQTGFTEGQTGAEAFGGRVRDALVVVRDFVRDELIPRISEIVSKGLATVQAWWDENGETVKKVAKDVFGSISGIVTGLVTVLVEDLLPAFAGLAEWLFTDGPGVEIAITGIAIALGLYAVNAALAAAATIALLSPFIIAAAIIGGLAWVTGELWKKFELGVKISNVFNDYLIPALEGFIETVRDAIELVQDLLDLITAIPSNAQELLTGGRISESEFIRERIEGARAHGGPVTAGMPYVVGEHRPELFVPDQDGTILPSVPALGAGSFIGGNLIVQQLPGEDAGEALNRTHRKIRVLAGMS